MQKIGTHKIFRNVYGLHTYFHKPTSSVSSVIVIKQKGEYWI